MPKKKLPPKAQKSTSFSHNICIVILLIVIAVSFKIFYFGFSVYDATDMPEQDHSWFNLMLYPLTPTISDKDANAMLQKNPDIVHIDVRDPKEYNAGHIPGAVDISEQRLSLVMPITYPDRNQLIYLNCNTGHKGAVSTRLLRAMGYTNAWNIADGLDGWKSSGYLVVK